MKLIFSKSKNLQPIMESEIILQDVSEAQKKNLYFTLKNKIADGFVILEQNDKLPYIVLRREKQQVDHLFNFVLCCITLGLWSFVWLYYARVSAKPREIIIAIDEDGNIFEENCHMA